MYSTSAVDNAMQDCFLLLKVTAPAKRQPDVDFQSSRSPAQSASE